MNNYTKKETDQYGHVRYYNHKNDLHRLDGPAVEWAGGSKIWYVNGKYHRLDGPAIEHADGGKYWYVNGKEFKEGEFNKHPLVVEHRLGKIIGEVLGE